MTTATPASSQVEVDVATADDLQWIGSLECEHYGGWRAVAQERLREWHHANPNAFLVIREGGQRRGHVTLLPLRPAMQHALAAGTRTEGQITAADIFRPHERRHVRDLYLESLIAEPLHLLGEFVSTFGRHVARLADLRHLRHLYAYPATDAGRLLMTNLSFAPMQVPNGTSQGGMYSIRFSALAEHTAAVRERLIRRRLDRCGGR